MQTLNKQGKIVSMRQGRLTQASSNLEFVTQNKR